MKRALIVIDVQKAYFIGTLRISYPQASLENILKTMDSAVTLGIPVIVVQHSSSQIASFQKGSKEWELHPEIVKRKNDILIEKNLPGSFTGTNLEFWLRENKIDTVVIVGYLTQMCCDTTARQALHLGFNVEFISDANGTLDISNSAGVVSAEELQRVTLVTQQMRFSNVLTTQEWVEKIKGN